MSPKSFKAAMGRHVHDECRVVGDALSHDAGTAVGESLIVSDVHIRVKACPPIDQRGRIEPDATPASSRFLRSLMARFLCERNSQCRRRPRCLLFGITMPATDLAISRNPFVNARRRLRAATTIPVRPGVGCDPDGRNSRRCPVLPRPSSSHVGRTRRPTMTDPPHSVLSALVRRARLRAWRV